LIELELWGES
jgi:hypothetical protein